MRRRQQVLGKRKEHAEVVLISSDSEGEEEVRGSNKDFDKDNDRTIDVCNYANGEVDEDESEDEDEDDEEEEEEEEEEDEDDDDDDDDYVLYCEDETESTLSDSEIARGCTGRKKADTGSSKIRAVGAAVTKKNKMHKETVKRKDRHAMRSEEDQRLSAEVSAIISGASWTRHKETVKRKDRHAMLSEEDQRLFAEASAIISRGDFGSLKMEHCKAYLRHHLLRLMGSRTVLLKRVQEHHELKRVGALVRYPRSSFTVNCTGDACIGDIVLFTQKVNKACNKTHNVVRPCNKRVVAGRIVKESYGSDKQQHTFTVEVLWSRGPNALPLLYPLTIKGRNLYRMKTFRQPWSNENKRKQVLEEKHARGAVARAARADRIFGKEHGGRSKRPRVSSNRTYRSEVEVSRVKSCATEGVSTKSVLRIPKCFAGVVIGRQGRNVAAITAASGARVSVCEDQLNPQMRLVEIIGRPAQIQAATEMVVHNFVAQGLPPPAVLSTHATPHSQIPLSYG